MDAFLAALKALAEPTRLRLFALCASGELTVSELVRITGQSQPRISRHLRLLTEAGVLERHREGSHVFHRLRFRSDIAAQSQASSPEEGLVAAIAALLPLNDPVLAADVRRLAEVKADRANAAAAYFRKNAARWNDLRSLHIDESEVEAQLASLWPEENAATYLDMGTGTGRLLELFADRCGSGVGLDLSSEMLTIARTTLEHAKAENCAVRHGDIYHVPFEDEAFAVVTVHQVLHFLDNPARAVAEAARVLAPGGRLLIVDFAPHGEEALRSEHEHRRLGFADDEIVRWVEQSGLETRRVIHLPGNQPGTPLTVTVWMAEKHLAGDRASDAQPDPYATSLGAMGDATGSVRGSN